MMNRCFAPALLTACFFAAPSTAQKPPDPTPQVEAMKKIAFLAGSWKGAGSIEIGPGGKKTFSQSETVTVKLSGLVAVIDGLGTSPDGAVVHQALGIVSFDPSAGTYRFSAYAGTGHVHHGDATVGEKTFEWGMQNGPVAVRYVIRLDEEGRWVEIGEMKRGESPWRPFFEMTLEKVR